MIQEVSWVQHHKDFYEHTRIFCFTRLVPPREWEICRVQVAILQQGGERRSSFNMHNEIDNRQQATAVPKPILYYHGDKQAESDFQRTWRLMTSMSVRTAASSTERPLATCPSCCSSQHRHEVLLRLRGQHQHIYAIFIGAFPCGGHRVDLM